MIREVFLPQQIGSYYVLKTKVVGIEITSNMIYATVVYAQGKKRVIDSFFEETIDQEPITPLEQRIALTLKKLFERIGNYDKIICAYPGKSAVIKEVRLPFTDERKISMVLPFEVEQLLPFGLAQAHISPYIGHQASSYSDVFAVATPQNSLLEYTRYFELAGLNLDTVTLDLVELYNLYTAIPEYKKNTGVSIFVDLDDDVTRLWLTLNGQLRVMRSFNITYQESKPEEKNRLDFMPLIITIQNFLAKHTAEQIHFFISGKKSESTSAIAFMHDALSLQPEKIALHKIVHNGIIETVQHTSFKPELEVSLAAALDIPKAKDFSLNPYVYTVEEKKNSFRQLITIGTLLLTTLLLFSGYSIWSLYRLKSTVTAAEKDAVNKIKQVFTLRGSDTANLPKAVKAAKEQLNQEEKVWFALSLHNRFAYLWYLKELSTRINREAIGLDLRQLIIKTVDRSPEDILILEGSVKNYEALRSLEQALQDTGLFKSVPNLQQTNFKLELIIDKNAV
jgi:hypothetical protein